MPGYHRKRELSRGSIAAGSQSAPFDASSFDQISVQADQQLTLQASLDGGTTWAPVQRISGVDYIAQANSVIILAEVPSLLRLDNAGASPASFTVEGLRYIAGVVR